MRITSPAFSNGSFIPDIYTCKGININPQLHFHEVPHSAKSLALIIEDVDVIPLPWVHWLVYNIGAKVREIEQDEVPIGAIEGIANGGTTGYEGPCQKYFAGIHHYHFRLFALNIILPVDEVVDKEKFVSYASRCTVSQTELIGFAKGEALI